jgi:hypothetical protein
MEMGMSKAERSVSAVPRVVIHMEGGVIHRVVADQPVVVVILDEEIEGGDQERIMEVNGSEVYVHQHDFTGEADGTASEGGDGLDAEYVGSVLEQVAQL